MNDNEYSRTKMRGFVMGLYAVIHMVTLDDDVPTFQEEVKGRIKACCEAWKIKLPAEESTDE